MRYRLQITDSSGEDTYTMMERSAESFEEAMIQLFAWMYAAGPPDVAFRPDDRLVLSVLNDNDVWIEEHSVRAVNVGVQRP